MKPILLFLAALAAGAVLASCATLSEAECEAGDWRGIGIADGANGRPASYVDNHISACSEYGIGLDRQAYETGRQLGLTHYCRLERAQEEGLDGDRYYGVCEGELGVSFARVYDAGKAVYAREADYNSVESELESTIDSLARQDLSEAERQSLRFKAERLQIELRLLLNRISLAERRLADVRRTEERRLAQLGITS